MTSVKAENIKMKGIGRGTGPQGGCGGGVGCVGSGKFLEAAILLVN